MSKDTPSYYHRILSAELKRCSTCFARVRVHSGFENSAEQWLQSLENAVIEDEESLPRAAGESEAELLLIEGKINYRNDLSDYFATLRAALSRRSRAAIILHNPYLRWLYQLAAFLGVRSKPLPSTFLTRQTLTHLLRAQQMELVRLRPVSYVPHAAFGLGSFLNWILPAIPGLRWLSLHSIALVRAIPEAPPKYSLSLIIPARNEAENIAPLLEDLKSFFQSETEVILIEGHSSDATWEYIQALDQRKYPFRIHALQQVGIGKRDAVAAGIAQAKNEVIAIVDADRSVRAEAVYRHIALIQCGFTDFANGNRLVYAMESKAMRFLNLLGNVFFAKLISYSSETPLGDTLCGTKVFFKADYARMQQWKAQQKAAEDPFGDFDLILAAASLGIGILEVPVQYLARQYGTSNISRMRDGLSLLKVTWFSFLKMRCGPWI